MSRDFKLNRKYVPAYMALKTLGVPVFVNEDNEKLGNFFINAEEAVSAQWVDWYARNEEWVFGVHPAVEAVLQRFGLFAEWQNPGCLGVYEN